MGIRDFGAIIKRHAPDAVQSISSLHQFRGQTLALDGNLLTAKFHFIRPPRSSDPQAILSSDASQTLRLWYQLLTSLRRLGISPVVVFDGDSRLQAKAIENLKRRTLRETERRRGVAETERNVRLNLIKSTWNSIAEHENSQEILEDYREEMIRGGAESGPREAKFDREGETLLKSMIEVYDESLNDADNAIYSRTQSSISTGEAAFLQSTLVEMPEPDDSVDSESLVIDQSEVMRKSLVDLNDLVDRSQAMKSSLILRSSPITRRLMDQISRIIEALGIPSIKPGPDQPHEGEGICAALYASGQVDAVVSEDTDVLLYGAKLLRKISIKDEVMQTRGMNVLDPVVMRKHLGLTKLEFLDFSLLCGTDFTQRIARLGPGRALALIREHKTIEKVLSSQSKYQPPDLPHYLETINIARNIFSTLPPLPANLDLQQRPVSPDLASLLSELRVFSRPTDPDEEEDDVVDEAEAGFIEESDQTDLTDEMECNFDVDVMIDRMAALEIDETGVDLGH